MANRERTSTLGSVESVSLRGRANTAGSVQSVGDSSSVDGLETEWLISTTPNRKHRKGSRRLSSQSHFQRRIKRLAEWLQKQRLPVFLTPESRRNEGICIVTGLDPVLFGTASAAETVSIVGVKPPRYLWYMVSGFLCDIIQLAMDLVLNMAVGIEDASLCWALSFCGSIAFRHTSHRYLVFGDYVGGYWASLGRMYAGYSVIIVLSTAFNILMTRTAAISHYVAWIATLLWTGLANYFILKKLWSFGGPASRTATTSGSK